jgi:hypothetical protein
MVKFYTYSSLHVGEWSASPSGQITISQKEPVIPTAQEGEAGCSGKEKKSCSYWKSNVQPIFSTA